MNANQFAASPEINSTSLCDHDYYGPLIDSYIKSILKSGLLLDEDLEVLLSISKFRHFPEQTGYKPSLNLLASIISVLSSSFLAKKLQLPLLVIPAAVLSIYFTATEYKNEKRKQDNSKIVHELLEVINKIQKLARNIIRYMKIRCDLSKKDKNALVPYGKNVEEFLKIYVQKNCDVLVLLTDNLKTFTRYSTDLQEDFVILEDIHYSNILGAENLNGIENCLAHTQKILDLNVFIFSKLLSYIGILFNSQTLNEQNCRILINERLPRIIRTLQEYHDAIKIQFFFLRHSANKKSEIQLQTEVGRRKNISAKLEATLISSVNNLSVILEKSQNVLDRLENENDEDLSLVGNALVDLRNHTYATYESLDLLCRLYGILSHSNINPATDLAINKIPNVNTTSTEIVPVISYNDDSEPVEERFELYIGAEELTVENPKAEYEDHSNAYLSLMLQELKQSLKQHERFIEAKNKRGDEDEEETEMEKMKLKNERKQSPPKFNLKVLRDDPDQIHVLPRDELGADTKIQVPNLPVPPPPPLPSFSLGDLQQESGQVYARSMLDNIKVLSSQRNIQEDVFGDSDEDSNSSD